MDWNKKNGHKNPMHFFRRGKGFFNGSSLVSFGAIKTKWVPLHVFSSQAAIRVVQLSKLWHTLQLGGLIGKHPVVPLCWLILHAHTHTYIYIFVQIDILNEASELKGSHGRGF